VRPKTFNFWVTSEIILCRHHQQFSINVCAGAISGYLAGPHVLPHRLTGNHNRNFLLHDLPKLQKIVPLAVRTRVCYTHVDAPAHFSRAVRHVPSNTCHDRWIARGEPTAWCPLSTPDLNPLNFYLWQHLNTLVYAAPVDNKEALHHGIVDVCQTIHNCPAISERMRQYMMRRVEACIDSHGEHFENLLYV
jgi:hypothetical protein